MSCYLAAKEIWLNYQLHVVFLPGFYCVSEIFQTLCKMITINIIELDIFNLVSVTLPTKVFENIMKLTFSAVDRAFALHVLMLLIM